MPGQIVAVLVVIGQEVRAGEPLVILEAMKMEHTVRAPRTGIISAIHAAPGEQAQPGGILLELATTATADVAPERSSE
jgi:3-methylcrotonyl-CoA carboxylase alpha subunit